MAGRARVPRGRWDEAADSLERYLRGELGEIRQHNLTQSVRGLDTRIRLGRADFEGALTESEELLTEVRGTGDPRVLPDALGIRARVLSEAGEQAAEELVDECLHEWEARGGLLGSPAWSVLDVEAACLRLGRASVLRWIVAHAPYSSPWIDACSAYADEEFARAAEIYAEIGARSEEALARLWEANRLLAVGRPEEAEAERESALAFFREAGATLYVTQAEALAAA